MNEKDRRRVQLDCLYEMFRDRIEENVVYIVYTENDGKIDTTIDQLMSIAACSFTGYYFENKCLQDRSLIRNNKNEGFGSTSTRASHQENRSPNSRKDCDLFRTGPYGVRNSSLSDQETKTDSASDSTQDDQEDLDSKLDLDQRIEKIQRDIDELLMEKNKSHDKASQYLSRKMFPVTSYYSELASQLRRTVDKKTKQLVDLLLEKSSDSDNIDLHGLNPIQARLVVSELLNIRQEKLMIDKQGEASFDIITGWGKHCVTNGQRIRPAIVALLREKGFEFHHLNKGALRVTIRR